MVRLRFFSRSPGRLGPWAAGVMFAAAGPVFAASSGVETLDAAVARELEAVRVGTAVEQMSASEPSAAGAPRRLPEVNDPSVRPVSGQTAGQTRPQPTPAQLEVMRQLEEMYKRDGRGPMPSLRMKDAPNTRLSNGKLPAPPPGGHFTSPSGVQPVSAGSTTEPPPAPAPATSAPAPRKPKNRFLSLFSRKSSGESRRPSLFDRLRGRTTPKSPSVAKDDEDGFFDKLFSPFRRDDEPQMALPTTPPAPPPLEYDSPSEYAAQPSAPPQTLRPDAAKPLMPSQTFPPAAPPMIARPTAPPAMQDDNPFREDGGFEGMVINPANRHPLEDEFAAVRGLDAPDVGSVATLDPEFADAPEFNSDSEPRTLDTQEIASDDEFAPVRLDAPPAEPQIPTPSQSPAARYAELQRKLAERAGLGGFQGFCPVALRDRRELIDSRPEFISVYEGRTYEFSSAEARARFAADPAKYAPVDGGNDVVLTSRGETEAEGCLVYAVWYKDRLYLFRTPESLREFNAEPTKYAAAE